MKPAVRLLVMLAIAALAALASGCATVGVHAWQRDILAKDVMLPSHDALDRALDDHIYFSKEASTGGRNLGGGGCGCN